METDDLADLINELLSDDETSYKKCDGEGESAEKKDDKTSGDDFFGNIDIEMLMKIGELFSELNKEDKNTALLLSLKPHLREENQSKVDTAVKLLKLMAIIPLLKDSGLFENML